MKGTCQLEIVYKLIIVVILTMSPKRGTRFQRIPFYKNGTVSKVSRYFMGWSFCPDSFI